LNIEQVPEEVIDKGPDAILLWMKYAKNHDVSVCDCCGDSEMWYGEAGCHFEGGDHAGPEGPYAYNGGLPECS
jgi:hypothetical protein